KPPAAKPLPGTPPHRLTRLDLSPPGPPAAQFLPEHLLESDPLDSRPRAQRLPHRGPQNEGHGKAIVRWYHSPRHQPITRAVVAVRIGQSQQIPFATFILPGRVPTQKRLTAVFLHFFEHLLGHVAGILAPYPQETLRCLYRYVHAPILSNR